ncbi:caspase-2-like [Branchiostoma floridae]|uniref:Caspase-2-like n=1 Tax=Branchiostoma floridae TaxID=7739 RepID=A0A9J7HXP8_BRAFL|nr:caspase-2-like [Branchiostoma floridae]
MSQPKRSRQQLFGQSARGTTKTDVSVHFDTVVKEASHNWDGLAKELGFNRNEIRNIKSDVPDQDRRCREVLWKWKNKYGREATLQVLQEALVNIEEGDTAQALEEGAGPSNAVQEEGPRGGSTLDDPKPHHQDSAGPGAGGNWEASADEDDGKINVMVKTCDEEFWDKIMNEKDPYRMDSKPRGYALILNNKNFTSLPYRGGSAVDLSNITSLFQGLSFETHVLEDKKAQEIKGEVLAFSQRKEHRQKDCCVVVLMSHGEEGVIFGSDDVPVQLDDIFSMFDNKNCPRLKGKPKLFFIQACRGLKVDKGVPVDEADGPGPDVKVNLKSEMRSFLHLPEDESDGPEVQPTRTEMLCGYATQLGYKSFRNIENGSWFIQAITKVFMEHAKDKSVTEMMPKVINDVSKRTASCPGYPHHGGKEEAEFLYKLHKPLYFFPGVE